MAERTASEAEEGSEVEIAKGGTHSMKIETITAMQADKKAENQKEIIEIAEKESLRVRLKDEQNGDSEGILDPKLLNSPRNATQTMPYKLVYGHEAVLPIDINLQSVQVQRQNELPVEDYWNLIYDELIRLDDERMIAMQNVIHQKEKIARVYNKKVKSKQFSSGDLVLKVILPIDQKSRDRGKWTYNREEPFIIERLYSNNAYLIKEINSRNASKVINGKYLKKFHESSMY
ncbi:uncharacterized protein LOC109799267 [Cajanus cajan]|uniref:uncharacterized protein LOC109799267 n=1 Tax=Cajanus cajan TaxID=3821 RepID=UPI00098D9DA9|nr:uncharacterized protein LOC109799267 [Cajanus cajan]